MLSITCPWCGERDEREFTYGGEAGVAHPADPEALGDEEWGRYLYFRSNPRGVWRERWCHSSGCRRWFVVERDTSSGDPARTVTP